MSRALRRPRRPARAARTGARLAIDPIARRLFVAQTYQPARVVSVSLDDPSDVRPHATAPAESMAAGLDGIARSRSGTLFAAANGAGEVWRIGTDGAICALARGLPQASAVAVGAGGAFPRRNVYAVTFGGSLVELPGAA